MKRRPTEAKDLLHNDSCGFNYGLETAVPKSSRYQWPSDLK